MVAAWFFDGDALGTIARTPLVFLEWATGKYKTVSLAKTLV
jgi:hypothetical protein